MREFIVTNPSLVGTHIADPNTGGIASGAALNPDTASLPATLVNDTTEDAEHLRGERRKAYAANGKMASAQPEHPNAQPFVDVLTGGPTPDNRELPNGRYEFDAQGQVINKGLPRDARAPLVVEDNPADGGVGGGESELRAAAVNASAKPDNVNASPESANVNADAGKLVDDAESRANAKRFEKALDDADAKANKESAKHDAAAAKAAKPGSIDKAVDDKIAAKRGGKKSATDV